VLPMVDAPSCAQIVEARETHSNVPVAGQCSKVFCVLAPRL